MQRFKLYALLLMSGLLLFLSGCQKDIISEEFYSGQNKIINPGKIIKISSVRPIEKFIKRLASEKGNRNAGFTIDNVDTTRILKVEFTPEYSTYTMNIIHNEPGKIYNLVFKEDNGVMYQPSVIEYHGTPEWVTKYNVGQANFDQFQGTFGQYRFSSKFVSGLRNGEIDCDCFKTWVSIVGLNGTASNGGGSSSGITIGNLTFGGFNTSFPNINSTNSTSGNSSSGTNISDLFYCPPGYFPIWSDYWRKWVCWPNGAFAGATNGPREPDGEMETLDKIEMGTRDDEKCINLIQGIGMLGNNDNKINDYAETLNPFVSQLSSCMVNPMEAKILELKSLKVIDACSGDNININVENLAMGLCFGCGKDGVGLTQQSLEDAFYEELDGGDYITYRPNQFSSCPSMQCLLNNLVDGKISDPLSNRICNIFQPKDNPKGLTFGMSVSAFDKQPDALAGASVDKTKSGKLVHVIVVNSNNCNIHNDPLKLLTTIQHELIHVDIHNKLIEKYGWNGSDLTMQSAFDAMILTEYPGKNYTNHHQLFIGEYLTEMLDGIRLANGGNGLPPPHVNDIYLGIVLDAFPSELDFIKNSLGYSKADIDKFVKNFNTWIKDNKSSLGIYNSCP